MKKVMTKEEAKKAAEAKYVELGHGDKFFTITEYKSAYSVEDFHHEHVFTFLFTELKDGDSCVIRYNDNDVGNAFFYEGAFWDFYNGQDFISEMGVKLVKTTGFNILEDMK